MNTAQLVSLETLKEEEKSLTQHIHMQEDEFEIAFDRFTTMGSHSAFLHAQEIKKGLPTLKAELWKLTDSIINYGRKEVDN